MKLSKRSQWSERQKIGYLMQQGVDHPDCLSLAAGLVDYSTLPTGIVQESAQKILSQSASGQAALQYGTTPGSLALRKAVLDHLADLDQVGTTELAESLDQVLITTGSQQCLDFATQAICDPGDIVIVTSPSYFVYLSTLEGNGVEIVSVDCDEDGICLDSLNQTLQQLEADSQLHRVKMLYLVTYADNPRGVSMSLERRQALIETINQWEAKQPFYVLEDAAYRELWFEQAPAPSLRSLDQGRDRVIYTQTFSKTLSPGLRTAFSVLPESLVRSMTDLKSIHDFGSPHLSQAIVLDLLQSGEYLQHVAKLREAYRDKANTMWDALEQTGLLSEFGHANRPAGGLYVWLELNHPEQETGFEKDLFHIATEEHHMMYVPGELFYAGKSLNTKPARTTMRLSYGVQPIAELKTGIERLAAAVSSSLVK